MARIDWNKVAEDYQNSSLDRERLCQYAKKAAEALRAGGIPFDSTAGKDWHEPPKPAPDMSLGARLRRVFIPDPVPPDTRPALVQQNMGYWVLETSEEELHSGHRSSEIYMTKSGYIREKKDEIFIGSATILMRKWVLLADGSLAVYTTKLSYGEYPYKPSSWWIKEGGSAAFRSEESFQKNFEDEWRAMTDEDILLLDHKKREVRRRWVQRDNYSVEDSNCIRMDNYLLTGKKGGGCSKKITALLKKHGL